MAYEKLTNFTDFLTPSTHLKDLFNLLYQIACLSLAGRCLLHKVPTKYTIFVDVFMFARISHSPPNIELMKSKGKIWTQRDRKMRTDKNQMNILIIFCSSHKHTAVSSVTQWETFRIFVIRLNMIRKQASNTQHTHTHT